MGANPYRQGATGGSLLIDSYHERALKRLVIERGLKVHPYIPSVTL